MPMIDITKGDNKTEDVVDREDTVQQMETAVNVFCEHLMVKHNQFDEKATFDELINYISKYQRILYSPISNKIYSFYEKMILQIPLVQCCQIWMNWLYM